MGYAERGFFLIQLQARVADLEKKLGEAKTSPAE